MTGPAIGRRAAGLLAASVVGQGAAAQGAAGRFVAATPPPCAVGSSEVVGLVLTGSGAPEGSIVVFGQAFRPGDVPRGAGLSARRANGSPLRLQMDVSTRHPDGSARFAVLALAAPALRRGETEGVMLLRGSPSAAPEAADWSGLGRLVFEVTAPGAAPWRADLPALARAAAARGVRPWQAGPLARQIRVEAPVPAAAAGGVASLRLVADLALRADGSLWADVWLRNDIAMRPNGGTASYSARLLHEGQEALRFEGIRQFQYTGLGRAVHRLRGAVAPPSPMVHPDIGYLADTGAVARYDVANGVDESLLARLATQMAAPAWDTPFDNRGLTQYMPTTGGRFDIGPATGWQAAWLISGDARAAAYAMGQAEAAGAVPWHFWDPGGGASGAGGWLDTQRWPGLWSDPRGGSPPRTLVQPIPTTTGWTPDHAHTPELAFVPLLLTGRRACLDELQAAASYSVVGTYPAIRNAEPRLGDVIVVNGGQVRGSAWMLRDLDNAAWISPEDDANTPFLRRAATANWSWLRAQLPRWTALQGQAHGQVPGDNRDPTTMAPWQQDYFSSTAAAGTARGNADARAVLAWTANFLAWRFLNDGVGFAASDGVAYQLPILPQGGGQTPFTTWAQIGAETRRRGLSAPGGWEGAAAHYAQLAIASLAGLVDLLGDDASREALQRVLAARPNGTTPADYRQTPTHAVVTRGATRASGQVRACIPPRGSGR